VIVDPGLTPWANMLRATGAWVVVRIKRRIRVTWKTLIESFIPLALWEGAELGSRGNPRGPRNSGVRARDTGLKTRHCPRKRVEGGRMECARG